MKRSATPVLLSLAAEELVRTLGERISLARRARQLTQPDLAAKVGVSLSTLRQMERGAPTVQIGFYVAALWSLDLLDELQPSIARLGRDSETVELLEEQVISRARRRP